MTGKFLRDTILLILILGLAGCASSSASPQATPTLEGTQPVDRLFSDLYRSVGGSIGPAISPVFERGNASCQYTLNALMCYDASLAENERFYLPPLAEELGLAWPEVPTATSELAIEGAPTLPEFYAYYYNNLFGIRFGGMPVSDVIYDYQQQRVEQYFQNIVLARNFTDPIDAVSLLPLGQYDCRQNHPSLCPSRPELQQEVADLVGYIDVPYRSMLNLPADAFAFGRVLTRPYLTADGMMQQIWENVVFTWPPEHPEQAHLIQLAYLMRMPGTQPGPQLYDMTQGIIFYPVGNGLGFHLPVVFDEFRAMHGGQDLSGPPIGDYMATADGKNIQQCFENYCLMYDRTPGLPEDLRIRLMPLGVAYRDQFYAPQEEKPTFNPAAVKLILDEQSPQIGSKKTQVVLVQAQDAASSLPLADLPVRLRLKLLDGTVFEQSGGPTDTEGRASLEIPPQAGFQHGLLVGYQVCLLPPSTEPVCQYGSYLIWDLP